jgi:Fe2+ transport system protein FeoA
MSEPAVSETLADFAVGQRGRVTKLDLPAEPKQRLLEMGLTVGTSFEVVRFAPLGDPIDIRVRGYHLSLRKIEAAGVQAVRLK